MMTIITWKVRECLVSCPVAMGYFRLIFADAVLRCGPAEPPPAPAESPTAADCC